MKNTKIAIYLSLSVSTIFSIPVYAQEDETNKCAKALTNIEIIKCLQARNRAGVPATGQGSVIFSKRGMTSADTAKAQELLIGGS